MKNVTATETPNRSRTLASGVTVSLRRDYDFPNFIVSVRAASESEVYTSSSEFGANYDRALAEYRSLLASY